MDFMDHGLICGQSHVFVLQYTILCPSTFIHFKIDITSLWG